MKAILLVDDSDAELELVRCYLGDWEGRLRIDCARHGAEALEYVERRGRFSRIPASPIALVVIDNKMPIMGGIEAVHEMRKAEALRFVPIVMWSGSVDPHDVVRAYVAGVSSYLRKPASAAEAKQALQLTARYWLELHCPPP